MHNLPEITESAEWLGQLVRKEKDAQIQRRFHMLLLLETGEQRRVRPPPVVVLGNSAPLTRRVVPPPTETILEEAVARVLMVPGPSRRRD